MTTRVNPVGWGLALFFLAGGILFWITIPEIFIGQIWVAVSLFLIVIYSLVGSRARAAARRRAEGLPGQATILEMTQTGTQINEQPLVKLKLQVEASGIEPYEIEKRVVVPLVALGTLTSGRPLVVYVDRENHDELTIDWGAGIALAAQQAVPATPAAPAAPATTTAAPAHEEEPLERLTELMRLKGAQLITDEEFAEQRKRILDGI
jgi:hypothetical protein